MLFLMNSPFIIDSAKKLAARIDGETIAEPKASARRYELVFARHADEAEMAIVAAFLEAEDEPCRRREGRANFAHRALRAIAAGEQRVLLCELVGAEEREE